MNYLFTKVIIHLDVMCFKVYFINKQCDIIDFNDFNNDFVIIIIQIIHYIITSTSSMHM